MTRQDQILEGLLARDPLASTGTLRLGDDEQTLERLYVEVMGLIPQAVDPIAPRPKAKARLMAKIADSGRDVPAQAPAYGLAEPAFAGSSSIPRSPAEPSAAAHRFPPPRPPASARAGHRRSWPLALAAVLAFAMAGLAAQMYLRLEDSRNREARLEAELSRLAEEQGDLRVTRGEMASLAEKLALITTPGAEVCPLRPPRTSGSVAGSQAATGVIFTAHGRWWLMIEGLDAPPAESVYQLWFVTDVGPIDGGTFASSGAGDSVELGSPTMPTGMLAVQITLEPAGGMPQPTGPTVLFGDEKMVVL